MADVSEDKVLEIIVQEIKKRKDALADFEKGNRPDLVADANAEVIVLQGYLPTQLSDEELVALISEAIAELGAASMKDMGKVMAAIKPKVSGRADNQTVSSIVKQCLSN